jgi:hypothetical protein|tara:strand:- start:377 stop:664 length:288 start_codon:yes stop_codon:yes gene_type:complete
MSITKRTVLSSVEFAGEFQEIHVQERTDIIETIDEKENVISESYHRVIYTPDTLKEPFSFNKKLPENLVPYVTGVWTDELIENYIASMIEAEEKE